MSRFCKPENGNTKRTGSPVNSVRNLQRKLSRQMRVRRYVAAVRIAQAIADWFAPLSPPVAA